MQVIFILLAEKDADLKNFISLTCHVSVATFVIFRGSRRWQYLARKRRPLAAQPLPSLQVYRLACKLQQGQNCTCGANICPSQPSQNASKAPRQWGRGIGCCREWEKTKRLHCSRCANEGSCRRFFHSYMQKGVLPVLPLACQ